LMCLRRLEKLMLLYTSIAWPLKNTRCLPLSHYKFTALAYIYNVNAVITYFLRIKLHGRKDIYHGEIRTVNAGAVVSTKIEAIYTTDLVGLSCSTINLGGAIATFFSNIASFCSSALA